MNKNEFRKIQLFMLDYIDFICSQNKLTYFLCAGTMLGAVRHKGFIPWDHDLDIALLRSDYERLISAIEKKQSDGFEISTYNNNKMHSSPHAILLNKNYKVVSGHKNIDTKIFNGAVSFASIDIFPIDNAPNNPSYQIKHAKKIERFKNILYFKQKIYLRKNFFYKKARDLIRILLMPISFRIINRKLDNQLQRFNKEETDYVVDGATCYSYKKTMLPKHVYSDNVFLEFEGKKYPVPVGYDQYLTQYYGDYLKFPSQDIIEKEMSSFPIIVG